MCLFIIFREGEGGRETSMWEKHLKSLNICITKNTEKIMLDSLADLAYMYNRIPQQNVKDKSWQASLIT